MITFVSGMRRRPQKKAIRLLARNVPPIFACSQCGKPADAICTECMWSGVNPFYCEACGAEHEHEDMLLPVTNSPRMGVCGYTGIFDRFSLCSPNIWINSVL